MTGKTPKTYYIDPTTDYGFKRIFGSAVNKDGSIKFSGEKNIYDYLLAYR